MVVAGLFGAIGWVIIVVAAILLIFGFILGTTRRR
jgi:hypothetical protein